MPNQRLTPEELNDIAARIADGSAQSLTLAALLAECRAAWAERDAARAEVADLIRANSETALKNMELTEENAALAAAVREAVARLGEDDYDGERVRLLLRAALTAGGG